MLMPKASANFSTFTNSIINFLPLSVSLKILLPFSVFSEIKPSVIRWLRCFMSRSCERFAPSRIWVGPDLPPRLRIDSRMSA